MLSRIRNKPAPPPGTAEAIGITEAVNRIILDCKLLPADVAIHLLGQVALACQDEEREHRRRRANGNWGA